MFVRVMIIHSYVIVMNLSFTIKLNIGNGKLNE